MHARTCLLYVLSIKSSQREAWFVLDILRERIVRLCKCLWLRVSSCVSNGCVSLTQPGAVRLLIRSLSYFSMLSCVRNGCVSANFSPSFDMKPRILLYWTLSKSRRRMLSKMGWRWSLDSLLIWYLSQNFKNKWIWNEVETLEMTDASFRWNQKVVSGTSEAVQLSTWRVSGDIHRRSKPLRCS